MKRLVMMALAAVAISASAQPKMRELTEEQRKAFKEARERFEALPPAEQERVRWTSQMKRFGGWLEKPGTGCGKVVYVNATKKVDSEFIRTCLKEMLDLINIKIEVRDSAETVNLATVEKQFLLTGAEAAIFLVDDPALPTLLVAPECCWTIVNVGALAKDSPDKAKFDARVWKEVWRAFGYLCGAADSQMPGCVMAPVASIRDLDRLQAKYICPEPMGAIRTHLKHLGVEPAMKATYRDACRQGWAHMPTNEYQKAIWEKVRALPQNPMKIEFDPKKGK